MTQPSKDDEQAKTAAARIAQAGVHARRSKSGHLLRLSFRDQPEKLGGALLADISCCTWLAELDLCGTAFEDAHVPCVLPLQRLQQLDLQSTAITDQGAAQLRELRALRLLNLRGARVSPAGIGQLRKQLIRVRILY